MSHTPAITAAFDATALAGTVIAATSPGGSVTLSSSAGVFLCPVGFANGYGSASGYTLADLLNADWPAAGTLTVGIDGDGFFYIESDTVDFAIDADPVNAVFGFDTAGQALVGGGAPFRQTAPNRFQRGIIKLTHGLMITPSAGASTEMPTSYPRVQNLPTWIRERGTIADADDLYNGTCLEDAFPASTTCVVEANGVLTVETPGADSLTSVQPTFALAVGWRGGKQAYDGLPADSDSTDANGRVAYTGPDDFGIPGFVPCTGMDIVPFTDVDSDSAMAGNGRLFTMERYRAPGFTIRFGVEGAATGRATDRAAVLRSMLNRADETVTVYPSWGSLARDTGEMETRRHRGMRRNTGVYGTNPAHTLLYTADNDVASQFYGPRSGGRLILLTSGEGRSRDDAYTARTRALQDVEIRLYVDPDDHPEAQDEV